MNGESEFDDDEVTQPWLKKPEFGERAIGLGDDAVIQRLDAIIQRVDYLSRYFASLHRLQLKRAILAGLSRGSRVAHRFTPTPSIGAILEEQDRAIWQEIDKLLGTAEVGDPVAD